MGGRCNHTGAKHLTLEIVVPYTCNISEPSEEMDRRKNDVNINKFIRKS